MSYGMIELGNPVLTQVAHPVSDVFSPDTQALINGMVATLKRMNGIGLAAPQVGVSQRLFIVAPEQILQPPYDRLDTGLVVINPEIKVIGHKVTREWEGCLSIPGIRGHVPRNCNITIVYTNVHGERVSADYTGFTARIFLHEFDHLNGIVFLDHLDNLSQELITDRVYEQRMDEEQL